MGRAAWLPVVLCLTVTTSAGAGPPPGPSFSCAHIGGEAASAEVTVEEAICADPVLGELDRSLSDAFRAALADDPQGRADLLASQRAWAAARAATCGIDAAGHSMRRDLHACLGDTYRRRLAVLRARDPHDAAMCRVVAEHVRRTNGDLASYSLGEGLRSDPTSPVKIDEGEIVKKAFLAALPDGYEQDDENSLARLYHFGTVRQMFAVVSVQGTAHCEYIALYKILRGGAFAVLDPPDALTDHSGTCGSSTFFGSYASGATAETPVPLYIATEDAITGSTLEFTARRDDAWHAACAVATSFETKLTLDGRFCAEGVDCDALGKLASEYARRRDEAGRDDPERLGGAPRRRAFEEKEQAELPTFGRETGSVFSLFAFGAPVYEVAGPTGPLFLRISHGSFGWRTDENWLVGVYRLAGKELAPLAGFEITKSRLALRNVTVR